MTPSDTGLDLEGMERVANAATSGPWFNSHRQETPCTLENFCHLNTGPDTTAFAYVPVSVDADFIATFDPPAVLALLARVKAAEAERDRWHDAAMRAGVIVCVDGKLIYALDGYKQKLGAAYSERDRLLAVHRELVGALRLATEQIKCWLVLVNEGGVPRYAITPGAGLNCRVDDTNELLPRLMSTLSRLDASATTP